MRSGSAIVGVHIEPSVSYRLIVLEPDTIVVEVQKGPYSPGSDKAFTDWSSAEGSLESARFLTGKLTDGSLCTLMVSVSQRVGSARR